MRVLGRLRLIWRAAGVSAMMLETVRCATIAASGNVEGVAISGRV